MVNKCGHLHRISVILQLTRAEMEECMYYLSFWYLCSVINENIFLTASMSE